MREQGKKFCLLWISLFWGTVFFSQSPDSILIIPHIEVQTDQLERTGRFNLKFSFDVLDVAPAPYQIRVAIYSGEELLFRRDHTPPTPSHLWGKKQGITYDLPSLFPLNTTRPITQQLEVYVGFYDPQEKKNILPLTNTFARDQQVLVASFDPPKKTNVVFSEEEEKAILEELKESKKSPQEAMDLLEMYIRRTDSYIQKKSFRKQIEKLGHFSPRPMTPEEHKIAQMRIWDEKVRYMRLRSGQYFDQGKYRAAYAILKDIGGKIEEQGREAVLGAVDEAKRNEQDLEGIRKKIFGDISEEDLSLFKKLVDADDTSHKKNLLRAAQNALKMNKRLLAWNLLRKVQFSREEEVSNEADKLIEELETFIIADLSPEEKQAVEEAKNPEAWGRLVYQPSHKFIFIGPKTLIEGLIANKKSTLRFDLAYIFLTDLFHYTPNPGGDRITVFFKELWDFGGGIGGGKIIDIGKANPQEKNAGVDNGLLYHELTHCIADITPGYYGFNEGIANFGAAFCFELLEQGEDQLHSFQSNLVAFREDYLNRELDFWLIQKYGPSAGFFLHFIDKYGKQGKEYEWNRYRQFFRDYRYRVPKDGRPRQTVRGIAYLYMKYFGEEALKDLIQFRFPLENSDIEVLKKEFDAQTDFSKIDWKQFPNSPHIRDQNYLKLKQILDQNQKEVAKEYAHNELGILYDFYVCGPFIADHGNSHMAIFAPEFEIDFKKTYPSDKHTGIWRLPDPEKGYVIQSANGWITLDFPYPNNTSYYALTHITSPKEMNVLLHIRADDYFKIFLNDEFIGTMEDQGENGSEYKYYRDRWAKVPDQMSFPVALKKGRNKLLIKITNGWGACGFVAALSDLNQQPISGLSFDTQLPDTTGTNVDAPKLKKTFVFAFDKKKSERSVDLKVGELQIRQKMLVGVATNKGVAWRKYTVRPGFPKDSPSNLFWLPKNATQSGEDFSATLQLNSKRIPKFTLTFDGEGKNDGLSGWTLIFHESRGGIQVNLEKYDHLVYTSEIAKLTPTEEYQVIVEAIGGKLTVQVNEAFLFKKLPFMPISLKESHRIGVCLWGPEVGIKSIILRK